MTRKVLCVIQARMGSKRLPGKVVAELDGRPLLRFLLDRLSTLPVSDLVVATTELERDDPVAALASDAGAGVVRGPEADVLHRFVVAMDAYVADDVIRLTADCPLTDPVIVEAVVARHHEQQADYTSNVLPRTFPKGLDVEVIRASVLREAADEATATDEREHVTPFVYRRPERFRLANLRSGDDLGDERWTVDTPTDLELVRSAVATLGRHEVFGWREMVEALGRRALPAPDDMYLRPAEARDSERVFEWRNDPAAVRFSSSKRALDQGEHQRWFADRLENPATRMWIGEIDAVPVGYARVDVEAGSGTVSIALSVAHRGRGLGRRMIQGLQVRSEDDCQMRSLIAVIEPANVASIRAFTGCEFEERGQKSGSLVFEWNRKEDS